MGVDEAAPGGGGIRVLLRRKQVDSDRARAGGGKQLAKELSITQLIAIGARSRPFSLLGLPAHDLYLFTGTGLRAESASFALPFGLILRLHGSRRQAFAPRIVCYFLDLSVRNSEITLLGLAYCWFSAVIFCRVFTFGFPSFKRSHSRQIQNPLGPSI